MPDNHAEQLDPREAPTHWVNQDELIRLAGVSGYSGRLAIKALGLPGRKRLANRKSTYYDPAWAEDIKQWALTH